MSGLKPDSTLYMRSRQIIYTLCPFFPINGGNKVFTSQNGFKIKQWFIKCKD